MLYTIEDLSFSYDLGPQKIEALRNLTLNIPAKALVTLSGPSGSGKSTLLNILGLIEPVQSGKISLRNEDMRFMNGRRKNEIRKYNIGFIFQQFHLMPILNAEENVKYFLAKQGLSKKEIETRTRESLEAVGLWQHRIKKPSELSGGQKQRVAIARALAKNPDLIIGDEITANLDQKMGQEIMEILSKLVKEKGISVILTTHDEMVQSYADYNFHIHDGQVV